tara:strand:+ start:712 stop:1281 length:570 start_codon:yes stop_codon:yes gene_type:complete
MGVNLICRYFRLVLVPACLLVGCDTTASVTGDEPAETISITAGSSGGMSFHGQWFFSVNNSGDGLLTVYEADGKHTYETKVALVEINKVSRLSKGYRGWLTEKRFGEHYPDDEYRFVVICRPSGTVYLKFMNFDGINIDDVDREELRNALEIRHEIRSWFDTAKDANDLRDHETRGVARAEEKAKDGEN